MARTRTSKVLSLLALIALGVTARAATAQEPDLADYGPLLERSVEAHRTLQAADENVLPALLEQAVANDTALIEWLDAFLSTNAFRALSAADQGALRTTRNRIEYYRATALIRLGRCDQARDRLRSLFDSANVDDQLRPRLVEAYDEATVCALRVRTATLELDATPPEAELLVDGVLLGRATGTHELEPGSHELLLRAEGYEEQTQSVRATAGGRLSVRVALEPSAPDDRQLTTGEHAAHPAPARDAPAEEWPTEAAADEKAPELLPWILIGAGGALVLAGLVYDLTLSSDLDELASLRDRCSVGSAACTDEELDRGRALSDDLGTARWIEGGLFVAGLAASTVGLVLLLTADGPAESQASVTLVPGGPGALGATLGVRF
jgi:hypothetical protein